MRVALGNADKSSPSFLFDISNLIIQNSGLQVNLQVEQLAIVVIFWHVMIKESYLRMQAATSDDELELSQFRHIGQFNNLSKRYDILNNRGKSAMHILVEFRTWIRFHFHAFLLSKISVLIIPRRFFIFLLKKTEEF